MGVRDKRRSEKRKREIEREKKKMKEVSEINTI